MHFFFICLSVCICHKTKLSLHLETDFLLYSILVYDCCINPGTNGQVCLQNFSLRTSDTQITSGIDSWILLSTFCSWRCKHCLFNRIVWCLYLRFYKKFQYLKGSKHHHFFLGTINFLWHQAPLGLFIDLINPHCIILSKEKINMLRLFYLISQMVYEF